MTLSSFSFRAGMLEPRGKQTLGMRFLISILTPAHIRSTFHISKKCLYYIRDATLWISKSTGLSWACWLPAGPRRLSSPRACVLTSTIPGNHAAALTSLSAPPDSPGFGSHPLRLSTHTLHILSGQEGGRCSVSCLTGIFKNM